MTKAMHYSARKTQHILMLIFTRYVITSFLMSFILLFIYWPTHPSHFFDLDFSKYFKFGNPCRAGFCANMAFYYTVGPLIQFKSWHFSPAGELDFLAQIWTQGTLTHILGPILVIFEICQFLTIPGPFEYFSENGWSQKIKVFSMKERSLPPLSV